MTSKGPNYICTASDRLDRGMDSGLHKESPDVSQPIQKNINHVL